MSQFATAEMVWLGPRGNKGKGCNVDGVARLACVQVCGDCCVVLRSAMRAGMISGENNVDYTAHSQPCDVMYQCIPMDMTRLTIAHVTKFICCDCDACNLFSILSHNWYIDIVI